MYAIIESGGKQYTIQQGDTVRVEKLSGSPGDEITIGTVLAINDGERLLTGSPYVEGASVVGKVVAQDRADKVTVFKYKRRKDTKKKKGHRQAYTEFLVEKIDLQGQGARENLSSEHGEREGKAPTATLVEGATRAPIKEVGASHGA
jgi:large subunit ribosomal protein L21